MRPGLLILCAVLLAAAACAPDGSASKPPESPPPAQEAAAYPYDLHDDLFAAYVTEEGLVRYRELGEDPRFESLLAEARRVRPDSLSERERLTFWVNAYNLLVLQGVLRYYPVESVTDIRLFHGFFKREPFEMAGRELVLDDIEHETLRAHYDEPRIHFALVCAALSCPPLRREAYRPQRLEAQLDEQGETFLADTAKNRLDREEGILYLSSIFDWFGEDFTEDTGELPVVLARWMPPEDASWIRSHPDVEVRFLDYDWSLNEAPVR